MNELNIFSDSSDLGRNSAGNFISILRGYERGDVVHEVLHSFGFIHEHARSDRNEYIRINTQNIRRGNEGRLVVNLLAI